MIGAAKRKSISPPGLSALWSILLLVVALCLPETRVWGFAITPQPASGVFESASPSSIGEFTIAWQYDASGSPVAARAGAALPADIASTFRGGNYGTRVLQSDVEAFRFSGGIAAPQGRFLTTSQTATGIATPGEAISALNLPSGATATQLNSFIIPKGTSIFYGRVEGGSATATQIFIQNPGVLRPVP